MALVREASNIQHVNHVPYLFLRDVFYFCWLVVIALCYLLSLSLSDAHSHGITKEQSVIFKCLGEKNNFLTRKQTPLLDGHVATISFLPSSH